ncbi:MAG: hypothetical protein ACJA0Q_002169 [Saprospiraceae bacterium]|jgi:hypothetical protein
MNNIRIKIKDKEPSDESILARKKFSNVISEYKTIKSSYAKVASIWGATVGMTVFLAFATTEIIGNKNTDDIQQVKTHEGNTPPVTVSSGDIIETAIIETPPDQETLTSSTLSNAEEKLTENNDEKNKISTENANSTLETENNDVKLEESRKINVRYVPE